MDGNRVQLRIKLGVAEEAEIKIGFSFPDLTKPIAECVIQAGADSCERSPFSALGWYWDPDGNATPERTITASVNGNQAIGSLSISVAPRPVVMVQAQRRELIAGLRKGVVRELGLVV